ncbi:hypothetical protein BOTBODRAFT_272797 [Botryobasidium botryosum FD-172 SS1]|uniref:Uncharacterized protein n=1 Tax=Botryobasidium botryosum (strain FD-172 SS1) TaxID=930990 RepID=A0A067MJS0_BOTB1|nr:hypothetical protein BOTBODRAFT_272797 [Botryobasidium botryosum FD-172 SS1]
MASKTEPETESIVAEIVPPFVQTPTDRIRQSCGIHAEYESLIEALQPASNARNTNALSALRYRQNQLAPVNRLPSEILLLIFASAIEPAHDHKYSPTGCHPICISGVCQRWRAVALGVPQLWACIDARGPRSLRDILASRSGNVPLHISVGLSKDPAIEDDRVAY